MGADAQNEVGVEMRLVLEPHRHGESTEHAPTPSGTDVVQTAHFLAVPPSGVRLHAPQRQRPHVDEDTGAMDGAFFAVQTLRHGGAPRLLLVSAPGSGLRVNGLPAPPVALLKERDEIDFAEAPYRAHVTAYTGTCVGTPSEEDVGATCPICTKRIRADRKTYRCAVCGLVLHCEDDTPDDPDALPCAPLCDECPRCRTPVRTEAGYTYIPAFLTE
jgi:hypothetical protein